MVIKEAIEYIKWMQDKLYSSKSHEACDLAISALEKQDQTAYKCCETCRHKYGSQQESPCCDCYLATAYEDYYEAEEDND